MTKSPIKRANWLELFYDLIFVYAISKATHILAHAHEGHLSIHQYFVFLLVFIPIWWAWTGHTLFVTRFDIDKPIQRILSLVQMLAVVFWTTFINSDFDPNYLGYLLFYILIRTILILMYWQVYKVHKHAAAISKQLTFGFGIGLLVALSSLFFEPPIRYFVLYLGISIEIITPLLSKKALKRIPVNHHHLPERYGLLTIILLGESVVMLASNLSNTTLNYTNISTSIAGFIIISSIWWLYFDLTEKSLLKLVLSRTGQHIIYGHLFIYTGLSMLAVFIGFSIDDKLLFLDDILLASISFLFLIVGFLLSYGKDLLLNRTYFILYGLIFSSMLIAL